MLDNSYSITYDAATVTMTKVKEGDYSSTYFGTNANDKLTLEVKHTIPARGGSNESHLVRLDVEHYDGSGVYLRSSSAWSVIKTLDAPQVDSSVDFTTEALHGFIGSGTVLAQIIARES